MIFLKLRYVFDNKSIQEYNKAIHFVDTWKKEKIAVECKRKNTN